MADIAVVFHWPPQSIEPMSLSEVMEWRERARERNQIDE